jgi:alpha-tubulin suppressor-like RCC1 family protein
MLACTVCHAFLPLLGTQQISAGDNTTCAVANGTVQCWGENIFIFNTQGDLRPSGTPVIVLGLSAVAQVTVGGAHMCALSNGGVKCWGDNTYGETGPNGSIMVGLVVVDGAASGSTGVSAGTLTTCAIVNGGARCWGDNYFGQLGNSAVPSGVPYSYSSTPVDVTGLEAGVKKIAVGTAPLYFQDSDSPAHVCAIVGNVVECWGDNAHGQLGRDTVPAHSYDPDALPVGGLGAGATDIASGEEHSCAVVNGAAFCWGRNFVGELGNNSVGFPDYFSQTPVAVQGLSSGVVAITASEAHSCALVNNDIVHPVKCWGSNSFGELGNGTTASSGAPVDAEFFPALTAEDHVTGIAAGGRHTCAVVVRSAVARTYCWGDNEAGQLGISDTQLKNPTPQTVVGISSDITDIATGSDNWHSCAVVNGGAQCWGDDSRFQLGDGISVDRSIALVVNGLSAGVSQVATGGSFSCAIVTGSAKCWGYGYHGVLGNNSETTQVSPAQVNGLTANVARIAASGGYISSTAGSFSSSGGHACAVVSDGVQCWGENTVGELGNPAVATGSSAYSAVPVAVLGLTGATDIAVMSGTSCAIADGGVQCWGSRVGNFAHANGSATPVGVTGLGSGVTALTAGRAHFCALQSGAVKCWGSNQLGELGNGDGTGLYAFEPVSVVGLAGVTAIAAGGEHSCAVMDGRVLCWGSNSYSEMGSGFVSHLCPEQFYGLCTSTPEAIIGLSSGVVALGAGTFHTCATIDSSSIKCWGSDFSGELGDGRILSAETPQPVILGEIIFTTGFEP